MRTVIAEVFFLHAYTDATLSSVVRSTRTSLIGLECGSRPHPPGNLQTATHRVFCFKYAGNTIFLLWYEESARRHKYRGQFRVPDGLCSIVFLGCTGILLVRASRRLVVFHKPAIST